MFVCLVAGDGGNDVSMIQAADCGIGIEGKVKPSGIIIWVHLELRSGAFGVFFVQEGKQASLAADFSITQFKHIGRLLMVHGRNSYKRSAALGQFVMHRGMIISTMQVPQRLALRLLLQNPLTTLPVVSSSGRLLLGLLLRLGSSVPGLPHGRVRKLLPSEPETSRPSGSDGLLSSQVRHHLHHVPRLLLGSGSGREARDGSALPRTLQGPHQGTGSACLAAVLTAGGPIDRFCRCVSGPLLILQDVPDLGSDQHLPR